MRRAEAQDSDLGLRHVHSHRFWFSPLFGCGCDPALPLLFVDGGDVKRNAPALIGNTLAHVGDDRFKRLLTDPADFLRP